MPSSSNMGSETSGGMGDGTSALGDSGTVTPDVVLPSFCLGLGIRRRDTLLNPGPDGAVTPPLSQISQAIQ